MTLPDPFELGAWRSGSPSPSEAIGAMARLMETGQDDQADETAVGVVVVKETLALLDVEHAILVGLEAGGGRMSVIAADGEPSERLVDGHPALENLSEGPLILRAESASEVSQLLTGATAGAALLLPVPVSRPRHVLVLLDRSERAFPAPTVAMAQALAAAGACTLGRRHEAEQEALRITGHAALTRAAKNLHESLDLDTVLRRIAQEATRILDGDYTAVYRGSKDGVVLGSASGLPPELLGIEVLPGHGLAGQVLQTGESMLSNDYPGEARFAHPAFADVKACLAVPMFWNDALRGVVAVGYERPFRLTPEHLRLLETFAELAAVACANASAHAGLALIARTDGLTGCLNHAALHESLGREIERAERSPTPRLSLLMLDLDEFKSVNETHGHLVGDEVLRRAGHALRQATRPYDIAARYGGDEFALVAVEADEVEAEEIGLRATERIAVAIGDLCEGPAGRATAGVAEWAPGVSAAELIARADRALLFGKHEGGRGRTILHSTVPEWFRPGRFVRRMPGGPEPVAPAAPHHDPRTRADVLPSTDERLRDRTRQLASVNALAARIAGMSDPEALLTVAASGLCKILDAVGCTVLRAGSGAEIGGEAALALRDRRPVLSDALETTSRIAVPLIVNGVAWGVMEAVAGGPDAFDEDDLLLAEAVAAHTGATLGAAQRFDELRRAYEQAVGAREVSTPPAA